MRLLKQVSRQVGDSEYLKWTIIVPPSQVQELGWNEGEELESIVKGKTLLVKPLVRRNEKPERMSYRDFKDKISALLIAEPEGLSWTEIRQKLQLPQKVPNNLWVRTLEQETGLLRRLDNKTAKVIWKLEGQKKETP
jgi:antitoxin component of MazEF toxin-antitoxin module